MPDLPCFISDVMLGSLAKWLRIMGFDVLYSRTIEDCELVRIAKQQQRILLTRDTGIAGRKGLDNFILVKSDDTFQQLKEVLVVLHERSLKVLPDRSRCAECNGELHPVAKGAVADEVPEHVFLSLDSFFRCSSCGKVYWDGSHKKHIDEKIRKIIEETHWATSESD